MADSKKYYYLRLKEDFYDDDIIKLLEAMPDGMAYSNILLKLYLKSLKFNGKLTLSERIPYNSNMLATITNHTVGTVEKALNIFKELGLIDVLDNGSIYMLDIQNFIGKTSTEADRKREYRERIEVDKTLIGQMSDKCPLEIEKEIETEKEKEIKTETKKKNTIDYQMIVEEYNSRCPKLPTLQKLTEKRKTSMRTFLREYTFEEMLEVFDRANESDFLTSGTWSCNFDWVINKNNAAKILEGNYENKKKQSQVSNKIDWGSV